MVAKIGHVVPMVPLPIPHGVFLHPDVDGCGGMSIRTCGLAVIAATFTPDAQVSYLTVERIKSQIEASEACDRALALLPSTETGLDRTVLYLTFARGLHRMLCVNATDLGLATVLQLYGIAAVNEQLAAAIASNSTLFPQRAA